MTLDDSKRLLLEAKERLPISTLWERLNLPDPPGGRRMVCSPFRPERTPSVTLSRCGKLWKDFGSGDGGDAVTFMERACGLSRADAIRELIRTAGLVLPDDSGRPVPVRLAPVEARVEPLRRRAMPDLTGLHPGTAEDYAALAALRGISEDAIWLAVGAGSLLFGMAQWRKIGMDPDGTERRALRFDTGEGTPCWVVTDPRRVNAQARRMDGQPWPTGKGGKGVKAMTVSGSWASWPLGLDAALASPGAEILLVEGGPDFLAGYQIAAERPPLMPVAMLGAGQPIHPAALGRLSGRVVRVVPHLDSAGDDAYLGVLDKKTGVRRVGWRAALVEAGASVSRYRLPQMPDGKKDLNDYLLTR